MVWHDVCNLVMWVRVLLWVILSLLFEHFCVVKWLKFIDLNLKLALSLCRCWTDPTCILYFWGNNARVIYYAFGAVNVKFYKTFSEIHCRVVIKWPPSQMFILCPKLGGIYLRKVEKLSHHEKMLIWPSLTSLQVYHNSDPNLFEFTLHPKIGLWEMNYRDFSLYVASGSFLLFSASYSL